MIAFVVQAGKLWIYAPAGKKVNMNQDEQTHVSCLYLKRATLMFVRWCNVFVVGKNQARQNIPTS